MVPYIYTCQPLKHLFNIIAELLERFSCYVKEAIHPTLHQKLDICE